MAAKPRAVCIIRKKSSKASVVLTGQAAFDHLLVSSCPYVCAGSIVLPTVPTLLAKHFLLS